MSFKSPRLLLWLVASVLLSVLALIVQAELPGNVIAVTLYKAHLLSLGGWGGYWLDRALFPYDRPHCYLEEESEKLLTITHPSGDDVKMVAGCSMIAGSAFGYAMLRRAIIVAAALICVGLGA